MKAKTLKQVNDRIKKEVGNLYLIKGNGYFYLGSDDKQNSLYLASIYSTSISVCHLNHQTVEQWIEDVKYLTGNYNFNK